MKPFESRSPCSRPARCYKTAERCAEISRRHTGGCLCPPHGCLRAFIYVRSSGARTILACDKLSTRPPSEKPVAADIFGEIVASVRFLCWCYAVVMSEVLYGPGKGDLVGVVNDSWMMMMSFDLKVWELSRVWLVFRMLSGELLLLCS